MKTSGRNKQFVQINNGKFFRNSPNAKLCLNQTEQKTGFLARTGCTVWTK